MLAFAHPRASTSSYLCSQFLANSRSDLHATSRSSHARRSLSSLRQKEKKRKKTDNPGEGWPCLRQSTRAEFFSLLVARVTSC